MTGPISFDEGLFGFPACHDFHLRSTARDGVYWLQSLEEPALAFVLVDPFVYVNDYVAELPDSDVARLGTEAAREVAVLVIATLRRTQESDATINLQAPIAINVNTGRARQVILRDANYEMRFPLKIADAA